MGDYPGGSLWVQKTAIVGDGTAKVVITAVPNQSIVLHSIWFSARTAAVTDTAVFRFVTGSVVVATIRANGGALTSGALYGASLNLTGLRIVGPIGAGLEIAMSAGMNGLADCLVEYHLDTVPYNIGA